MNTKPTKDTLAEFAEVVLEIMEHDEDWIADTLDRISNEAVERKVAHLGADSMFKAGPR